MSSQYPWRRVVCTGMGMISPLGNDTRGSWSALLKSKIGVTKLKEEHSYNGCQSRVAAYVDDKRLQERLNSQEHQYLAKNAKQLSRATTFAMLATHEALIDAHMLDENNQVQSQIRNRCGVAIGQGMVDFQDIYENGKHIEQDDKSNGYRKISPFFMTRALMNMSAGNVCIRYKIHGPNHCVSTACATGAHSLGDAFNMIRLNIADTMICGSTEASINKLAVAGFERLRALSTKYNDNPESASRPFDVDRCGFVMGEGCGIVILEELEHAKARGLTEDDIYCEILGYGMSSDSHHLTAPLPDGGGAKMCMKAAMISANLEASDISHVNSHATSTPLGDDIECNALEEIFGSSISVTSCKGSIGHLLGGAGSVESIFAMLSCKNAILPHCPNLKQPLATSHNAITFIQDAPKQWTKSTRTLLKNSFGFGGTNASIIMRNYIE